MMRRPAHILVVSLGIGWSQSLLVAGLWLIFATALPHARLVPAVGLIGAGLFVAMWLVIDRLVSEAGARFAAGLKLLALGVFYAASALALYGVVTGRATMLFLPL